MCFPASSLPYAWQVLQAHADALITVKYKAPMTLPLSVKPPTSCNSITTNIHAHSESLLEKIPLSSTLCQTGQGLQRDRIISIELTVTDEQTGEWGQRANRSISQPEDPSGLPPQQKDKFLLRYPQGLVSESVLFPRTAEERGKWGRRQLLAEALNVFSPQ